MSDQQIRRFPREFVVFHAIMFITVTMLIVTGLPLRWGWWEVTNALGGHDVSKWIHRSVGIVLIFLTMCAAAFAIQRETSNGFKSPMWPKWRDLSEMVRDVRFLAGALNERPRFAKFNYQNKIEFWAAAWGMFIMCVTGLVLWFPELFNGLIIEVSHITHSWEAMLALVSIYGLHLFHVHSLHGKIRINQAWITGTISADDLRDEHPEEYDKLVQKGLIIPPVEEGGAAEEDQ